MCTCWTSEVNTNGANGRTTRCGERRLRVGSTRTRLCKACRGRRWARSAGWRRLLLDRPQRVARFSLYQSANFMWLARGLPPTAFVRESAIMATSQARPRRPRLQYSFHPTHPPDRPTSYRLAVYIPPTPYDVATLTLIPRVKIRRSPYRAHGPLSKLSR